MWKIATFLTPHLFSVPPLALPNLAKLPKNEDLVQYASVSLFVQRAQIEQAFVAAGLEQRLRFLPLGQPVPIDV